MAKAAIKPPTKSQILTEMAESTGLAKKDVAAVLDALTAQIAGQMGKDGIWPVHDSRSLQSGLSAQTRNQEASGS